MQQTKSGEKRFFLCIVLSAWSSTTRYKCPFFEVFSGHMNHHFPIAVFDADYFKVRNWITITLTMHQCIHLYLNQFHTRFFLLGRVESAGYPGGLEIPHGQQQS